MKNGDSLAGTSYYYTSANNFRRYSIKGYFDPTDNSVIWWDDQLIEEKNGNSLLPKRAASRYVSNADFNCPGGTKMYLTGKAALKEKPDQQDAAIDLQKFITPFFRDEWDYIIDNYTVGANDPYLIDSIGQLAFNRLHPHRQMNRWFQRRLRMSKNSRRVPGSWCRKFRLPAIRWNSGFMITRKLMEIPSLFFSTTKCWRSISAFQRLHT